MLRRLKILSILIGMPLGSIVLYVIAIELFTPRLQLPVSVVTIQDLQQSFADGHKYVTFQKRGGTYFEAQKMQPLWTLPSGPTCYVFNSEGRLTDWIDDSGESSAWNRKWGHNTGRLPVSYEEIILEINN